MSRPLQRCNNPADKDLARRKILTDSIQHFINGANVTGNSGRQAFAPVATA
jgi:hypothetical protein